MPSRVAVEPLEVVAAVRSRLGANSPAGLQFDALRDSHSTGSTSTTATMMQLDSSSSHPDTAVASDAEAISAVRLLKNEIIGSLSKKTAYAQLAAIPLLVELLDATQNDELKLQVVATLGSLAHDSNARVAAIVQAGGIAALTRVQAQSSSRLLEALMRTLKIIVASDESAAGEWFSQHQQFVNRVAEMIGPSSSGLDAVYLFSRLHTSGGQLTDATLDKLAPLLQQSASLEPTIEAFAALLRSTSALIARRILALSPLSSNSNFAALAKNLLKHKSSTVRLHACSCLISLYKANVLPLQELGANEVLMPALVKLLGDASSKVRILAPQLIARLVDDHEELQKLAIDPDVINKLAVYLKDETNESNDTSAIGMQSPSIAAYMQLHAPTQELKAQASLRCSALLALAALCSKREENRKAIADARVLPKLVELLEYRDESVRIAACQLARSLSRSVKHLRSSLVDAGVAKPLLKLLSDPSTVVQTAASATICNIVLDFSPMKKMVLESGGVAKLVELSFKDDHDLRLNCVWALKNILYQAELQDKNKVLSELGWSKLYRLLNDTHEDIREQALTLVRNLVHGALEDIGRVMAEFGEPLLEHLQKVFQEEANAPVLVQQALYVVCNIATGSEAHKTTLIQNPLIMTSLVEALSHADPGVRVAAVWCVINLAWAEETGASDRVARLRELHVDRLLLAMSEDYDLDVRDRVKTALEQFAHFESDLASVSSPMES
ncbi:hypothetical protein CAOG_05895 [Capsaspora owczarzaki ATCC 30864]|nr:hypothetical protein CAOG_05895 [Capsaspora owczarzaki ATCC 30864]|eukprot:XP_004345485.1 hypothetical protein CAOG_05895 [Capsaspora owczarzaki ATCC 30864]